MAYHKPSSTQHYCGKPLILCLKGRRPRGKGVINGCPHGRSWVGAGGSILRACIAASIIRTWAGWNVGRTSCVAKPLVDWYRAYASGDPQGRITDDYHHWRRVQSMSTLWTEHANQAGTNIWYEHPDALPATSCWLIPIGSTTIDRIY